MKIPFFPINLALHLVFFAGLLKKVGNPLVSPPLPHPEKAPPILGLFVFASHLAVSRPLLVLPSFLFGMDPSVLGPLSTVTLPFMGPPR